MQYGWFEINLKEKLSKVDFDRVVMLNYLSSIYRNEINYLELDQFDQTKKL